MRHGMLFWLGRNQGMSRFDLILLSVRPVTDHVFERDNLNIIKLSQNTRVKNYLFCIPTCTFQNVITNGDYILADFSIIV